jgi:hypothetical protein
MSKTIHLRQIIPHLVGITVAVLFIILNLIGFSIARLPYLKEAPPSDDYPISCLSVYVAPKGFPVRINQYDFCGTSSEIKVVPVVVNAVFGFVMVVGSVYASKSLIKKMR